MSQQQVIVSLTSFPPAISYAARAVQSILNGSVLPDKVVLYLTFAEFGEKGIPQDLQELAKNNLMGAQNLAVQCGGIIGEVTEEAVRIFSLGRIENLTITEKTFKLPKKFEFSNKCGNGRFGTFISENTDKYKIEFYDFSRPMVKSSIWADDQVLEDDEKRNCTTITFTSTQTVKVEEWVLSQGMYAKPLEPKWLVEAWKAHIKNMCKMAGIKS